MTERMIIDTHAHAIPGGYPEGAPACFPAMEAVEGSTDRELVFGQMRFRAKDVFWEAERRVAAMDASGTAQEVISPMPPLLRWDLGPDGVGLARHVNEFVTELCSHDSGRMLGLGMSPLGDPDAATAMLAEIKQLGLLGVEVTSNVLGKSIGDEQFLPFFQEAERLGLAIFVHAMPSPTERLPMSTMGTYVVGVEGAFAAASIATGGVAAACPDLRISFSHAAGGYPLMVARDNYFRTGAWNEEPVNEARIVFPGEGPTPWEIARRFYYDSLVFDRRSIAYLIEVLGADRLLVGSDFAAMPREEPLARTLLGMDLDEETLADITHRNARRWLALP